MPARRRIAPSGRHAVKYNWNWGIFWQTSADGHNTWFMTLIHGLGWTLVTALCAGVIAIALAIAVRSAASSRSRCAAVS